MYKMLNNGSISGGAVEQITPAVFTVIVMQIVTSVHVWKMGNILIGRSVLSGLLIQSIHCQSISEVSTCLNDSCSVASKVRAC